MYLLDTNVVSEFRKSADGRINKSVKRWADEISPDSCRFWDALTKEKLDKDVFRRDLGSVENAYLEIARKIGVVL